MNGEFHARPGRGICGGSAVAMKGLRSWGCCGAGRSAPLGQARFWKFLAAAISGAALSMASVGIDDEEVAVCAGDLDRPAGGAQVEEVQALLRIVLFVIFADRNSVSRIIDLLLYSLGHRRPAPVMRRFVRAILDTVEKPESGDGNYRTKAQRRKDRRLLTIQALASHSPNG